MNKFACIWCVLFVFLLGVISCPTAESKDIKDIITYSLAYVPEKEAGGSPIWPDEVLKESFSRYWEVRFAPNLDNAWSREAPHLQYMGSKKAYKRFHSRLGGRKLQKITVSGIDKEHQYLYTVICKLHLQGEIESQIVHLKDYWVQVDKEWYHVGKNPIIFPSSM